jgi:hypothetical protein
MFPEPAPGGFKRSTGRFFLPADARATGEGVLRLYGPKFAPMA